MVFRGCLNSNREQYTQEIEKKREKRKGENDTQRQHASILKYSIFLLINSIYSLSTLSVRT